MPDLLLELRSEEIPARMQARAADDLRRLVTDALVERGLLYEGARAFSTPRRLTLHVAGLPAKGQDRREERKGPRVGAPEAAVQGFLRSAGLGSVEQATVETDPKKGSFYTAVSVVPGRATLDVLAEVLPKVVAEFPWPKSMRWGAASAEPGSPRWVRPLQSIVATLDTDTEEPQVIPFEAAGVRAGQTTFGHRFLAPAPIAVRRLDDYEASLRAAKVRLDREDRKNVIRADAANLAFAQGLEVVEDEALLEEVAGLVEWPVVMMGSFDERFLDVPAEAIRATIRANQKCFVLRDPATGRLANRFLLTANTIAADGGATIVAGNERVIRARLSDAKFFWDQDRKVRLEDRLPKLRQVTFHARLGSQWERVGRVVFFVRSVAAAVDPEKGGDLGPLADLAARGAVLAKADLTTEMVGEFPELQGLMGRYYATLEGEDARVCAVIEDHYKPLGPSDRVPTDLVGAAVALADKLDMLVCFWAIGETPSGSKDPYALRRAALGVIRIVLEKELSVPLRPLLRRHAFNLLNTVLAAEPTPDELAMTERANEILASGGAVEIPVHFVRSAAEKDKKADVIALAVVAFLHERLKVQLREQGARHDLVDAVLAANAPSLALPHEGGGNARDADLPSPPSSGRAGEGAAAAADDLLLVARRVAALGRFLATEDGATLLAGYRRAANILRAEEKKDGEGAFAGAPDPTSFIEPAERALHEAIIGARAETEAALARDDDEAAMGALARLRAPVDAFFEAVMVNAPDPEQRLNRLRLLDGLRSATRSVADFGRIAG